MCRSNSSAPKATTPPQLIIQLLTNIQAHPGEAKYRTIRPANPRLAAQLFAAIGATPLLVHLGWRKHVQAFQENYTHAWDLSDEGPQQRVTLALGILREYLARGEETKARKEREQANAAAAEDLYKARIRRDLEADQVDRHAQAGRFAPSRRIIPTPRPGAGAAAAGNAASMPYSSRRRELDEDSDLDEDLDPESDLDDESEPPSPATPSREERSASALAALQERLQQQASTEDVKLG
jgi:hypothetical protein